MLTRCSLFWRWARNRPTPILLNQRYREMSTLIPLAILEQSGTEVILWLGEVLTREGFRFVQTFDLQAARGNHSDCFCPYHGTDACDCQMIVLLVYGRERAPVTLVVHSHDSRTWLSMADGAEAGGSPNLARAIRRALSPQMTGAPVHLDVRNAGRPAH